MEKIRRLRFWKKLTAIALVVAMVAALCGCVRYRAVGTVHEDGTMSFYVLYATMTGTEDAELSDEERAALEKEGWSIQPYKGEPSDEEEYSGYVISKNNIPLEQLHNEVASLEFGSQSLEGLTCTKQGEIYTIEWDVDGIQQGLDDYGLDGDSLFSTGGFTEFVVKLPNEAKKDNATSRKGLELTWDINSIDEPIHLEFELETIPAATTKEKTSKKAKTDTNTKDGVPMWLAIVLISAVAVLAIASVVVVIVVMKKKKASAATSNSDVQTPTVPQYAPQQPMQSPYAPQQPMQSPYAPQQPMQSPYAPQQPMQSPYAPQQPMQSNSTPPQDLSSTFGLPMVGQAPSAGFDDNQHSRNM